ncbi:MAG TPA: TRAP transporter substrate-binding protein, partial [Microvirga sp.]|nr:TRAP transporter substrate-binding protein [Microvirga sp.]
KLNATVKGELTTKGMQFNDPDPALFREALRKTGFYAEWKKKYGDEAWAILEKSVGSSLS